MFLIKVDILAYFGPWFGERTVHICCNLLQSCVNFIIIIHFIIFVLEN